MGMSQTKPASIGTRRSKPKKLERRKSMSMLKTGTTLSGSYRLPNTNKLSKSYFKSIFSVRTLPNVSSNEIEILLKAWKKHSKDISDVVYPNNPERVFPKSVNDIVKGQLKGGDLRFGTLKLSDDFFNAFESLRDMELCKSALARAIAQVPTIKKLDLFDIGISENAATQFLLCMEDFSYLPLSAGTLVEQWC